MTSLYKGVYLGYIDWFKFNDLPSFHLSKFPVLQYIYITHDHQLNVKLKLTDLASAVIINRQYFLSDCFIGLYSKIY